MHARTQERPDADLILVPTVRFTKRSTWFGWNTNNAFVSPAC